MMDYSPQALWYGDVFMREVQRLEENKTTGNIEFLVHFKNGAISHVNCGLNKCIRKESEVTNARQ